MKHFIRQLMAGQMFTRVEMQDLFTCLLEAQVEQQAAVLVLLSARGETVDEIMGARDVLIQETVLVPDLDEVVDIVGTGGDGLGLFNVSTAASLLVASCGVAVAKHGGRGSTGSVGSADVAEQLGLELVKTPEEVKRAIGRHHYAYLWGPHFNNRLKSFGPLRRTLGVPGLLNVLGPLMNPTQPKRMVLGVYRQHLLPVVAEVLKQLQVKHAMVVYGEDGIDKISLSAATQVAEVKEGQITMFSIQPEDVGLRKCNQADFFGTTASENAALITGILCGEVSGPKLDMVLLNAAAGLVVAGQAEDLQVGIERARRAIVSGESKNLYAALLKG